MVHMSSQIQYKISKVRMPFFVGLSLILGFWAAGCTQTVYTQTETETMSPWKEGKYAETSRIQDKIDQADAENDIYPWQIREYPRIVEAFDVFAEGGEQATEETIEEETVEEEMNEGEDWVEEDVLEEEEAIEDETEEEIEDANELDGEVPLGFE